MKPVLKFLANASAAVLMLPAVTFYWLGCLAMGRQQAFQGWTQALSLLPGFSGVYLRRAFYRMVLPRCGAGSVVGFGATFSHPTAEVGRSVYIGPFCLLGDVTLDDDVLLGSHVSIANGGRQHGIARLDVPVRDQPGEWTRITIGQDSWIGDRAVVLANVGQHCVVAAGAVVTRAVPDYAIVAGVPARMVGDRRNPAVQQDHDTVFHTGETVTGKQIAEKIAAFIASGEE